MVLTAPNLSTEDNCVNRDDDAAATTLAAARKKIYNRTAYIKKVAPRTAALTTTPPVPPPTTAATPVTQHDAMRQDKFNGLRAYYNIRTDPGSLADVRRVRRS
jgi:hypothetical protein